MASKNETWGLVKDFTKVMVLEGRAKVAEGLYAVAEKVDTTEQQKTECSNFHIKMQQKRLDKERLHAAHARC